MNRVILYVCESESIFSQHNVETSSEKTSVNIKIASVKKNIANNCVCVRFGNKQREAKNRKNSRHGLALIMFYMKMNRINGDREIRDRNKEEEDDEVAKKT